MVVQLDDKLWFPDPHYGEEDGLIAVGGDLSVDRLLLAYSYGIFPWYALTMRNDKYNPTSLNLLNNSVFSKFTTISLIRKLK